MQEIINALGSRVLECFRKRKSIKAKERAVSKQYMKRFGRKLNWDNPTLYTEKINYAKIHKATPQKAMLSDKYSVRDWVKEKVGEQYLIPLLGVYDSFNQIDFDALPEQFVIKCSHDCGSVKVIKDKSKINKKKLSIWYSIKLKSNYAYRIYEMQYETIKPRLLIEKYMEDSNVGELRDYKFICLNGKPLYCWVDMDRFDGHKRVIYDMNWERAPFNQTFPDGELIEKPACFDELKDIASKLCEGFDQVRVDLYEVENRPYFGEMTFTSANGMGIIRPEEWDEKLGKMWDFTK